MCHDQKDDHKTYSHPLGARHHSIFIGIDLQPSSGNPMRERMTRVAK